MVWQKFFLSSECENVEPVHERVLVENINKKKIVERIRIMEEGEKKVSNEYLIIREYPRINSHWILLYSNASIRQKFANRFANMEEYLPNFKSNIRSSLYL